MNSKIHMTLASAACVLGCALGPVVAHGASSDNPAAASDAVAAGPAPSAAHVWMTGHWVSEGGQWKWVMAHWELPPSTSATWISGHWVPQGASWVWANGAWSVGDPPQSNSVPPTPPGQAAQAPATAGTYIPMPSTPAPVVYGEYGPDGVERAIDQPPVTTDYGPVQYDSAYPGYYWTYDPWYWGGYPWAYFGWGAGFYGWGGGYAHWGHSGYYGRGGGRGGNSGRGAGGYSGRGATGGHFGSGRTH